MVPPKVMTNGSCLATTLPWKHCPPLCHLDRSAAKWRDLRFSGPFMEMFFLRSEALAARLNRLLIRSL
jgi:hypothetical protein